MANETSKLFGDNRPNSIHSNGPTFYFLDKDNVSDAHRASNDDGGTGGWFKERLLRIFGFQTSGETHHKLKPRKVPVKVEPKVFFSNERTFIAWMHMGVTLSTISVAILSFSTDNKWSQLYGLVMLPVAIAFVVYAMIQYMKRAGMIRRREAGPYEDIIGPVCLACLLMASVAVNFTLKLVDLRSKNN
eukprot:467620_1